MNHKKVQYFPCKKEQQLQFSESLFQLIEENLHPHTALVLLCIGTDKVTGDSLGPFVGHRLEQYVEVLMQQYPSSQKPWVKVYGTLQHPVHAVNLEETLLIIQKETMRAGYHPEDCLVLVVDASLGYEKHLGYVTLSNQPLRPGEGVKKKLPHVGQISITGIIGESRSSSSKSQMVLRRTKLYDLIQLSDFISDGIYCCLKRIYLKLSHTYRIGTRNDAVNQL